MYSINFLLQNIINRFFFGFEMMFIYLTFGMASFYCSRLRRRGRGLVAAPSESGKDSGDIHVTFVISGLVWSGPDDVKSSCVHGGLMDSFARRVWQELLQGVVSYHLACTSVRPERGG